MLEYKCLWIEDCLESGVHNLTLPTFLKFYFKILVYLEQTKRHTSYLLHKLSLYKTLIFLSENLNYPKICMAGVMWPSF